MVFTYSWAMMSFETFRWMYLHHAKYHVLSEFFSIFNVAGMEAVGIVTAVGAGRTGIQVGDLVGYAGQPMGSYAEEQILPANKVIPIPSSIEPAVAASVLLKGMTAQILLRRCFKVGYNKLFFTIMINSPTTTLDEMLSEIFINGRYSSPYKQVL